MPANGETRMAIPCQAFYMTNLRSNYNESKIFKQIKNY